MNQRVEEELTELLRVDDLVTQQTGMAGAIGSLLLLCNQARKVAQAVRMARLTARKGGIDV